MRLWHFVGALAAESGHQCANPECICTTPHLPINASPATDQEPLRGPEGQRELIVSCMTLSTRTRGITAVQYAEGHAGFLSSTVPQS